MPKFKMGKDKPKPPLSKRPDRVTIMPVPKPGKKIGRPVPPKKRG